MSTIDRKVAVNADGTRTVTTSFELTANSMRPIDDDAVDSFDRALAGLGAEVMHAVDPTRIMSFESGGPPVWSVAMARVRGAKPQTLLLTYGMSSALSPGEPRRDFEYSLALPAHVDPSPWADALLRHFCRYVLTRRELAVGDVMPCYAPITCVPFRPQHHAAMPKTDLVGIVAANDPVLPRIRTAHGDVEVRRFVGIDQDELDRVETWSATGFVEEYAKLDPLLLTDPSRPSSLANAAFREKVDARARREGSVAPAIMVDASWEDTGKELTISFPGGREAKKLLDALNGRVPFGQQLNVFSRTSAPIVFRPAEQFDINWSPDALVIDGRLDDPNVSRIVAFIRPDSGGGRVRMPLVDG